LASVKVFSGFPELPAHLVVLAYHKCCTDRMNYHSSATLQILTHYSMNYIFNYSLYFIFYNYL